MKKVLGLIFSLVSCFLFGEIRTDHFLFLGLEEEALISFSEENFSRISHNLSSQKNGIIVIECYGDRETFNEICGYEKQKELPTICEVKNGRIYLLLNETISQMKAKRELTKALARLLLAARIETSIPKWVMEGYGFYEMSKIAEGKGIVNLFNEKLAALSEEYGVFPFMDNLFHSYPELLSQEDSSLDWQKKRLESAALSYSFVEFIIEKWGFEAFIRFCKTNLSFEEGLMMSKERVATLWYKYETGKHKKS